MRPFIQLSIPILLFLLSACGYNANKSSSSNDAEENSISELQIVSEQDTLSKEPQFPYQHYLDSMDEDDWSPIIDDDGDGFKAISHNIRYPEIPDTLMLSHFADTLLQCYNYKLAYNTMAYDVGTAERYMSEPELGKDQADALDSINLAGFSSPEIREALRTVAKNAAAWLREGVEPYTQKNPAVAQFYDAYNRYSADFIKNHTTDDEFDPKSVLIDYDSIHIKALTDTTSFRQELLERALSETDFNKKCVLVREFAYANYYHPQRDDKELVAVIDQVLRANQYSPLLRDLWRMWRLTLQLNLFGGRSNDAGIYNLFYNDMRNRIALVYIAHLNTHPHDKIAFKEFFRLSLAINIVRTNGILGNYASSEEMAVFESLFR